MRQVVLITGRLYTGKPVLAKLLQDEFDYHLLKSSDILKEIAAQRSLPDTNADLSTLGNTLDVETDHSWILERALSLSKELSKDIPIVVDNIRNSSQLEKFRQNHDLEIIHVHLYASKDELQKRFEERKATLGLSGSTDYFQSDHLKNLEDIESFKLDADVRINTAMTDDRDTLVRVAARLGLYSPPDVRCVDVIIGGQYGSEGKGHVAAYLANEYDVLVRVGGPNAGHTVSSPSGVYTYHQLPSGARDTDAQLLLGPGMTINVDDLLNEISDCKITPDRLFIDPQAMVIEPSDLTNEKTLVTHIASTGRGSGAAAARRILERGDKNIRLAKDIPSLEPYVGLTEPYRGSTVTQLEKAYRERRSILLEGTQGSGLSIFHGKYPYVTSRDTNVAGCLAEAGISPNRVRRTLMVIRLTPIRVGNPDGADGHTSGPLKHEIDFVTIANKAGIDPEELLANEKTSTTKRDRRVGWFEWEQFRQACALNAPTDIVLTFSDYMHVENRKARRFEQLTEGTIKFIEELERVAQAPVSLINTRFMRETDKMDLRSLIDRRNWTTHRTR